MGHIYDVHTSDGRVHQVETNNHHSDHSEATFGKHLLDVLKGAAGGFIGGSLQRFVYRGRR